MVSNIHLTNQNFQLMINQLLAGVPKRGPCTDYIHYLRPIFVGFYLWNLDYFKLWPQMWSVSLYCTQHLHHIIIELFKMTGGGGGNLDFSSEWGLGWDFTYNVSWCQTFSVHNSPDILKHGIFCPWWSDIICLVTKNIKTWSSVSISIFSFDNS